MIQIKYKDGSTERVRLEVEVSAKAIYRKELMTEEYVLLTFDTAELVNLRRGDYIETGFGRFVIVHLEKPKRNVDGNGGYTYEQKFHAPWERWTTRKLFYARQRGSEKAWSMTQKPEYFMQIVIDNILAAGYGVFVADIDASLTEMKLVQFDGDSIVAGLNKIAEAWETEWWVSDNVLHLKKCEYGSPVVFEEGDLIRNMTRSDGQENDYITRLYAFGSTRNIPTNYRKSEEDGAVIESIVERRLKLPEGTDHIDAWPNLRKEDVVEGVAIFDDVYPRRTGTCRSISTEVYRDEVKDDEHPDGELVEWNAYRFKDSGIKFKSDYILPDEELRLTFQSGALAGMDFAVVFNPDGADESSPEAQVWEIVRNDTYGIELPNDKFHPEEGDEYVLYGYDTKMVSDLLIPRAEQELLEETKKLLAKKCVDSSTYTCETDKIRCAGYTWRKGRLEYERADEVDLDVGQSIELRSDNYFSETGGCRVSRVRAFEKRLDNKFAATYEVGETASYSKSKELDEKVESLTIQNAQVTALGCGVYLIKRHDGTIPSDHNAYSSLRADTEFLHRGKQDSASALIRFLAGLEIGKYALGRAGAAIDAEGNAEVESLTARGVARVGRRLDVGEYVPGTSGASVWVDERGEAHIETATITVNKKMTVKEVEIQEQTWVGGSQIISPAGMTCAKVEEVRLGGQVVGWTCSFRAADADGREVRNEFRVGDLARCETFNLVKDAQGMTVNRYYWRKVGSLGTHTDPDGTKWHSVVLSNIAGQYDPLSTCGPAPGDRIITVGNDTDPDRQNVIITASYGDGSPYIYQYAGVDTFSLAGKLRTAISPSGNVFTGRFLMEAADGSTRDVAQSVSSLQVQADGIMSKVGMVSRNLVPQGGRWDSNTQECDIETLPGQGGFRAEEAARLSEWQSFRCEVDSSLFRPSTDYILTLYAMFQDEEEGSVVSSAEMAFRAGVLDVTHGVRLCPWASPDVKILTPGEYVPLTFRLRSASSIPAQKMFLQFIIRDWEGRTGLLRLDFREIKLEEGSVATPWVPADKDIVSVVAQQADRIDMAVKVDGKERAGLTLDAEEGITLAADKVRVKNGGLTAALFANGILNADLMQVGKLATIVGGQKRITVSEHDDGFIRFYHEDGATVAMKLGLDIVSLESQQAITPILPQSASAGGESAKAATDTSVVLKPTLKGKPAMAQVFDEDGKLTWVLFLDGPVTPDTQTYSWRTWSLVRETAQNSALLKTTAAVKAQEYWQFKVKSGITSDYSPYRDRLFIKKMSDTDFTSAASYYVPDGRYFYPSAELALATVTNPVTKHIRRYYDVVSGKMTSGQMDVSEN